MWRRPGGSVALGWLFGKPRDLRSWGREQQRELAAGLPEGLVEQTAQRVVFLIAWQIFDWVRIVEHSPVLYPGSAPMFLVLCVSLQFRLLGFCGSHVLQAGERRIPLCP